MNHEPPTSSPAALLREKRKRALRLIGIVMSSLMVLTVLAIFLLIVRTERAHDESRCAFTKHSVRSLGEVLVVEEARSCLPELEERRYLVARKGTAPFELARKRLPRPHFAGDRYRWTLREDDTRKLVVRIEVDGQLSSEFFEEDLAR
jgi:hypothetical protein